MADQHLPTQQMSPDEFKQARESLGASVTEIARAMNFGNARTVRRYEDGEVPASGPSNILMEIFLHVPGAYEYACQLARKRNK